LIALGVSTIDKNHAIIKFGLELDREVYQAMKRIMSLFLAALVGFSALAFGSCKSEVDKAGKALDESMEKAKEHTGRAMEKTGQAIKEAGEKMQQSGKAENKQWHSPFNEINNFRRAAKSLNMTPLLLSSNPTI
jgi:hypothetical protein